MRKQEGNTSSPLKSAVTAACTVILAVASFIVFLWIVIVIVRVLFG